MRKTTHWLLIFSIVFVLTMTACSGTRPGVGPVVGPLRTVPPPDSNPVFLATPVLADPSPIPGDSETTGPVQPTDPPVTGVAHELYFVVTDFSTGRLSLARLPYACILQNSPCAAEVVPSYPNVNETIHPLRWSPIGNHALLPFFEGLHRYDPAVDRWEAIAHVPVSELPEWSPNGEWIAFISRSGNMPSIHILRPDGSEPLNLTANRFTSPEDHLSTLFWLDNENMAFWYMAPGKNKGLFQINIHSGEMAPLIQMSGVTKDILAYSPDHQRVALETFQNGETWFALSNADGSGFQALQSFGQASIWPMIWSPDGQSVAFAVYQALEATMLTRVFIASREGQAEIQEVFSAELVPALAWAPDSQRLVIQAEKNSPARLFVVDTASGEAWPLAIEGLGEGASISGISWR